jgi:hypothetical protein
VERAAALERSLAVWLAGRREPLLPARGETTVVLPPDRDVLAALGPLIARLSAEGIAPGRVDLLVAAPSEAPPSHAAFEPVARRHAVRVVSHDPDRSPTFPLSLDDVTVAIDDALRETEALVLVACPPGGAGARGLTDLLLPGLASAATRRSCAAPRADGRTWGDAAAALLGIDLAIAFAERADGVRVHGGTLDDVARALAGRS